MKKFMLLASVSALALMACDRADKEVVVNDQDNVVVANDADAVNEAEANNAL